MNFLTFAFPRGICCPGFLHVSKCLDKLMLLADATNRVAIFPPPYVMLNKDLSGTINAASKWSQYFQHDTETPIVHTASGDIQFNSTILRVRPLESWKRIKDSSSDLVVIDFDGSDGILTSDCFLNTIANYSAREADYRLTLHPSAIVQKNVASAREWLGVENFAVMHLRRGDVLQGKDGSYSYYGCGSENLQKVTSVVYVSEFWRKLQQNQTLIVMTNEKNNTYLEELKLAVPGLIFEWNIPCVAGLYAAGEQLLGYETMRHLSNHATIRISTAACYLIGGCEANLCEEHCTCKHHRFQLSRQIS